MSAPVRLSVTMLDTYVSGMADESMSAEALARRLFLPIDPVPLAMQAGTALHTCLEHAGDGDDLQLLMTEATDGFVFLLPDHLDGLLELGTVREHKQVLNLGSVHLVGKFDALTATHVIDHKLAGKFDAERYMDSLQWRAYLMMTGRPQFAYQVFEHCGIPEDLDENGNHVITIRDYHRMELAPYAGMRDDVLDVAHDLASFARDWLPIVRPDKIQ